MAYNRLQKVKVIRPAPAGDPVEVLLRGYSLALRKNEAMNIMDTNLLLFLNENGLVAAFISSLIIKHVIQMPKPEDHPPEFRNLYRIWMRIRNKMNLMENMPPKFGMETPLFLSEIHTIQAIARTKENNIRTIAQILGVTPSAASQKERVAYDNHEMILDQIYERIAGRIGELTDEERAFLSRIFSAFESVYNERIVELASHKSIQSPCIEGPSA